jgi:hypothetical protein
MRILFAYRLGCARSMGRAANERRGEQRGKSEASD